jgi:enamine deaminase RidA (YjgF/YER057c/UK114 family)
MGEVEDNLGRMGITLPLASPPRGLYSPAIVDGPLLYVSGAISCRLDGSVITGRVGDEVSLDHGIEAARYCALAILARAKSVIGDLDLIERLLSLRGFVNSTPGFANHPEVIDGASRYLIEILGPQRANHARFAVGSVSLPRNASVEIEATIRLCVTTQSD